MATPIKATPKLSNNQFDRLRYDLESNRSNKESASKRAEMKALLEKVLSNKK